MAWVVWVVLVGFVRGRWSSLGFVGVGWGWWGGAGSWLGSSSCGVRPPITQLRLELQGQNLRQPLAAAARVVAIDLHLVAIVALMAVVALVALVAVGLGGGCGG